jgi:xylulose-5-phosphate/fructose-6-phosphate phosphoketolase
LIDRVDRLKVAGAHAREAFKDEQISCRNYAFEHGIDKPEVMNWTWPY